MRTLMPTGRSESTINMVSIDDWVDELCSGKWVPAHGCMKSETIENGRCPYGVLAELLQLNFSSTDVFLSMLPVTTPVTTLIPWYEGFPEWAFAELYDSLFFDYGDERAYDGEMVSFDPIPRVLQWMALFHHKRGVWPRDPWQFLRTHIMPAGC